MSNNENAKLLVGLVIGAAVGAAVCYVLTSDKKDQILNELHEIAGKAKESFNSVLAKYKEAKVETADVVEE